MVLSCSCPSTLLKAHLAPHFSSRLPPGLLASSAYETASLQALVHLQATFGFIIADYSIHGLLLYQNLARHLFPIANRGIHIARLVIATSSDAGAPCPLLLAVAQQLIDQVGSVPDGMVF